MNRKILAAIAAAASVCGAAHAAPVVIDFTGAAPDGGFAYTPTPGEFTYEEGGFVVTGVSNRQGGLILGANQPLVRNDSAALYIWTNNYEYTLTADGGGAFDLSSFATRAGVNAGFSFLIDYVGADGATGTVRFGAFDRTLRTLAPDLENIVSATFRAFQGDGMFDDIVVEANRADAIPVPAAAFLFAPAAFGLLRARKKP